MRPFEDVTVACTFQSTQFSQPLPAQVSQRTHPPVQQARRVSPIVAEDTPAMALPQDTGLKGFALR